MTTDPKSNQPIRKIYELPSDADQIARALKVLDDRMWSLIVKLNASEYGNFDAQLEDAIQVGEDAARIRALRNARSIAQRTLADASTKESK